MSKKTLLLSFIGVALLTQTSLAASLKCQMDYTTNNQTTRHMVELTDRQMKISSMDESGKLGDSGTYPDGLREAKVLTGAATKTAVAQIQKALDDKTDWIATLIDPAQTPPMNNILKNADRTFAFSTQDSNFLASYDKSNNFMGAIFAPMGIPVLCKAVE